MGAQLRPRSGNCLAVQSEVAAEIAVELKRELFPPAQAAMPTRVPGAHEAYLRAGSTRTAWIGRPAHGRHLLRPGGRHRPRLRPRPFVTGARLLSLANNYVMDGAEALRIARDSAKRALAIDPDDGDALVVIGEARRVLDHDPAGARAAFEKVLALNPSSVAALRYYG